MAQNKQDVNKDATRRWRISVISRFIGIIVWSLFMLFTVYGAKDIWLHALIQVLLVILGMFLIIIIPDKIIFQEFLVETGGKHK